MSTNHLVNHIVSVEDLIAGAGTVTSITIDSPGGTIDVTNGTIDTSGTVHLDVDASVLTTSALGLDDPGVAIPTAGATVSCAGPQLIGLTGIRPTGTLATLTIHLVDGIPNAIARIMFTQIITALTVTGNTNLDATRSLLANPTAITAGQILEYWWDESGSSPCWIRAA